MMPSTTLRGGEGELGAPAVAAPGQHAHRDAERDGDSDGEQERQQRERERGRQPLRDHVGDRQLGDDRGAEVAGEQVLEVVPGTATRAGRRDPAPRAVAATSVGRRGRAERRPDRVARDQVDHQERRGHQHPQRHQQAPRTPYREPDPRRGSGPTRGVRDHRGRRCDRRARHRSSVTPRASGCWSARAGPGSRTRAVAEGLHHVVGEGHDVGGGEQGRLGLQPGVAAVRRPTMAVASLTPAS